MILDICECTHPIYNIYLFEIYFKKREIIRRNSCRILADHLQFVFSPSDKKKTGYSMEHFLMTLCFRYIVQRFTQILLWCNHHNILVDVHNYSLSLRAKVHLPVCWRLILSNYYGFRITKSNVHVFLICTCNQRYFEMSLLSAG